MNYDQATRLLPDDATCTASFGYRGEAECEQYWRAESGLYIVAKQSENEWTCKKQIGPGLWYEVQPCL